MTELIPAFAAGWLLTLALLIIEHLLWNDAPRLVRYLLGAGTLCVGCALAGAILDNPLLAFGPWVIASAGLVIVLMTWYDERTARQQQHAQKRGEVIGATRGLTQELIDAGGKHGSDRPRSQN
jgi:membrane protein implicated in regulation of membrane protease activity